MNFSKIFSNDTDSEKVKQAFEAQEEYEEIVEIDERGRVFKPGEAPRSKRIKPTILRDPEGEYAYSGKHLS